MKILSIKKIKNTSKRYDLSVKKYHAFFANGMFVHNSSITVSFFDGDYHVCTRNHSLKFEGNEENTYIKTSEKYLLRSKLATYGRNLAIQGELCGPGIQKNRLELKEYKIFVFNIWDIDKQTYVDFNDMVTICYDLDLDMVPIIDVWMFNSEINTVSQLLEMANDYYEKTKNLREGIVIRPVHEAKSCVMGGRLSFKCLCDAYLIQNKE